jgi:hypothetical protein
MKGHLGHWRGRFPVLTLVLVSSFSLLHAQTTTLTADGTTDTYTLINSVLGGTAEETPDCSHPSFGPHITQSHDNTLNKYVFDFWIHVTPDNDRCINFDRQRNEIKTYGPSPAAVKAFLGDTMDFRWQFQLASGFQPSPSFTHVHQVKAGDGNADAPMITVSTYSGSPDVLRLNHWDDAGVETVLANTDLTPFKGAWVEADEHVYFNWTGTYSITIKRVSDGAVLFTYTNNNIEMWRTGTTFVRPKWGIYRSLNDSSYLRDEDVLFGGFCIGKSADCPSFSSSQPDFSISDSPASATVSAGNSASTTVTVSPANGFSDTVNLSASGLPTGGNASFSPSSIPGGSGPSTLTISTSTSTPASAYTIVVTGTDASGSPTHSASFTLTINAVPLPDFTISASPNSLTVNPGSSGSSTISVIPSNGFADTVNLSASGLPPGATASFNPGAISGGSGSSTLTLATSTSTPLGTYTITVTGTDAGGSPSHSIALTLTVKKRRH